MQKRKGPIHKVFCEHPESVGENYFAHLCFTLTIFRYLIVTAFCALAHGLLPLYLQDRTSRRVCALAKKFECRAARPLSKGAE